MLFLAYVVLILALVHGLSTIVYRRPMNLRDGLAFALALTAIPLAMGTAGAF